MWVGSVSFGIRFMVSAGLSHSDQQYRCHHDREQCARRPPSSTLGQSPIGCSPGGVSSFSLDSPDGTLPLTPAFRSAAGGSQS